MLLDEHTFITPKDPQTRRARANQRDASGHASLSAGSNGVLKLQFAS